MPGKVTAHCLNDLTLLLPSSIKKGRTISPPPSSSTFTTLHPTHTPLPFDKNPFHSSLLLLAGLANIKKFLNLHHFSLPTHCSLLGEKTQFLTGTSSSFQFQKVS
jgi:hypothetical protein